MSEEKVTVDINFLIATAQMLEREIEGLQRVIAEMQAALDAVTRAKDTITAIAEAEEPFLVPADGGRGVAFYLASPADRENFLLHLGLGVYVKAPRDKVLERLGEEEERIKKDLEEMAQRLAEARERYAQVQALLQQVQAAMIQQAAQARG